MGKRHPIRRVGNVVLPTIVGRYLRKTRHYQFRDLSLAIPPGVFHPGLFLSTRIFIDFLDGVDLAGKRFLELGAGSGMIALYAQSREAVVTATDISPLAVNAIRSNAERNLLEVEVIQSDLFSELGGRMFDLIVINPPYYADDPKNDPDKAWYCGKNFEYFETLFSDISNHGDRESKVLMILSEDCDIARIRQVAQKKELELNQVFSRRKRWEWHYIYEIICT